MSRKIAFELKEIEATSVTSVYQNFGSVTKNPCIVADIINTSDTEMYLSVNGVDNVLRVPAGGTITFDTSSVKDHADESVYVLGVNIQLQIKLQNILSPATWGNVYTHLLTVTSK